MIEIKHRFSGVVLFKSEKAETIREAVVEAVSAGANLARAYLAGAYLADANLAGAYLADANLAGANLAGAYLADANLAGAYLAGANLADANLAGANLAGAYLADAYLADANLAGARNVPTGTEKTDPPEPYKRISGNDATARAERAQRFRERYPNVPVVEDLDAKILGAVTTGGGQLEMGSWHVCETTHCRGGWAINLAGAAGRELENDVGVEQAARMIYIASTGRVPHFYVTNERALEDIKRCAAASSEQPEGTP